MPITPASTRNLPLPVQIFSAAMEQQLPLADYAQRLGISHESLRAVVTAQRNQVEAATLDRLANVYNQSRETLRDQLSIAPPHESFGAWLKRNMEGVSQHALRNRVQMDSKTLKQLLNAETLPDSDQAERISRALYIDRTEIARVVIANLIHQANADRLVPAARTSAEESTPPPVVTTAPAPVASRSTRRQSARAQADRTAAEAAAATQDAAVEPALERERPRRAASARQAGTALDAATELVSVSEGAERRRPAARRQASAPAAAPTSAPTPEPTLEPMSESEAQGVERPRRPATHRPKNTTADGSATTLAADTTVDPAPAPEVEQPRQPAARRQAGTSAAAKSETTSPVGSIAHQNNSGAVATESETPEALSAPNHHASRKQRRSGPVSKKGSADAAPPAVITSTLETPTSEVSVEPALQDDSAPISASAAPAAAATASAAASTTAEPAPASVSAVLAADPTTLQLSPDEVRLIRHWRQLHPHGRRATLHYIGSLLVDD